MLLPVSNSALRAGVSAIRVPSVGLRENSWVVRGFLALVCVCVFATPASAAVQNSSGAVALVDATYEGLLGRSPDPDGGAYWAGLIDAGVRPGEVVQAIGDSTEYRRKLVTLAYEAILERRPDPSGHDYWAVGLVDRLSSRSLSVQLLSSQEYFLVAGGTDEAFIAALYRTLLDREPDAAGAAYWVGLLGDGVARAAISEQILASAEGILQPDLSIVESSPAAGATGSVDRIRIRLDRDVDVASSAVVVAVDGVRVTGTVVSDPADPAVLVFAASSKVPVKGQVVVTVFAATPTPGEGFAVSSVDYEFVAAVDPTADPTGELIVAFYGHPRAPVLGVAGEGTPEQALQRLRAQAAPYEVTGRPIVPAFELISTLVTASPGPDRLYRSRATDAELRRYLDVIRTVDGRLILDIQPGRADVLDEAQAYETLLIEPEVGLALDPEWVVGPNQTPSGRIGSLDAAEINRVSAYLSGLVGANDLPPKILIIHRFRRDMVTNPDLIESPPGVRILFHADGEGGPAAKIGDYDTLMPARFEKGIKIFYDEDVPTMTPAQLLQRANPDPTYVSYQ